MYCACKRNWPEASHVWLMQLVFNTKATCHTVVLIIFATRLQQKPLVNQAFAVSELKAYVDGEVHVRY